MTRAVHRFREFQLIPDTEPGAEPLTYVMQCAVCEQSGEPGDDQAAAHTWATGSRRVHGVPRHVGASGRQPRSRRALGHPPRTATGAESWPVPRDR
ncbi:DUF7848 domain-containing protein [Streptomyces milbemycinicus]